MTSDRALEILRVRKQLLDWDRKIGCVPRQNRKTKASLEITLRLSLRHAENDMRGEFRLRMLGDGEAKSRKIDPLEHRFTFSKHDW